LEKEKEKADVWREHMEKLILSC